MTTLSFTTSPLAAMWLNITRNWFGAAEVSERPLSESAAELLRRAEVYAATQPGYAADLRAAAQRMMDQKA